MFHVRYLISSRYYLLVKDVFLAQYNCFVLLIVIVASSET